MAEVPFTEIKIPYITNTEILVATLALVIDYALSELYLSLQSPVTLADILPIIDVNIDFLQLVGLETQAVSTLNLSGMFIFTASVTAAIFIYSVTYGSRSLSGRDLFSTALISFLVSVFAANLSIPYIGPQVDWFSLLGLSIIALSILFFYFVFYLFYLVAVKFSFQAIE